MISIVLYLGIGLFLGVSMTTGNLDWIRGYLFALGVFGSL